MGVDEIYFGKQMKFITVVSNLETGELLWFGQDREQETLDEFFRSPRKPLEGTASNLPQRPVPPSPNSSAGSPSGSNAREKKGGK